MRRGWEFWLGTVFVAAAVLLIAPAFLMESWREIISEIGAATAAFAVVGAALIAYDGATAKVRFDNDLELLRDKRERANLLVRLRHSLVQLSIDAREIRDAIALVGAGLPYLARRTGYPDDFKLQEPPALSEAWGRLDVVPTETIHALGVIRLHVNRYQRLLSGYSQMVSTPAIDDSSLRHRRFELRAILDEIIKTAAEMKDQLL